jgi:hypothetical protein
MPTSPVVKIRIRSDCDAVLKIIASLDPAPLVDCKVRVEDTAVPPFTKGITALVVTVGVAIVGEVANTNDPVPVSSVTAAARLAELGVARNVATLAPNPLTPVETGKPVQLVRVPEVGVPNSGVAKVGLVANTSAPLPVSSVTAAARLELEGVARNVATPLPSPDTPVEIGRPVQLVRVPDVGVPIAGVTRVGDVASTTDPVPVTALT